MNCPNCGAKNDADARFCAECGTPLDNAVLEASKVEEVFEEADEEQTIISPAGDIAAEAKTLAVDQAEVVAAVEEVDNTEEADDSGSTSEPESSSPPTPSSADAGGDDQDGGGIDGGDEKGEGDSNRTLIIVGAIVVVVLLLCCCCSVLVGGVVGSDRGAFEDIIEELSMLPVYLPLV